MAYRTLLVHLDAHPRCTERSRVAIGLAKSLDCHLVGVAATGLIELPAAPAAAAALAAFADRAWDALVLQAVAAAQRFEAECRAAGLMGFEAIVDKADVAQSLVRHAHGADLTLLTQADPAEADHSQRQALVEQLLFHSARPTLVLPCSGRIAPIGTQVLVAWDDSREAARAVADALPLLRRAERVRLLRWIEGGEGDTTALRERLGAQVRWLARQGVRAEAQLEPRGGPVAESMLASAAGFGADLIVMGAYGHSRWAERLLGGATRGLMHSMTVPVLMSH